MHTDDISLSEKPEIICDCNKIKVYVDVLDQMCAYTPFVRKTTKWYLRLFFHLITLTTLVNAWKLYCNTKNNISVTEFKSQIIEEFRTVSISIIFLQSPNY